MLLMFIKYWKKKIFIFWSPTFGILDFKKIKQTLVLKFVKENIFFFFSFWSLPLKCLEKVGEKEFRASETTSLHVADYVPNVGWTYPIQRFCPFKWLWKNGDDFKKMGFFFKKKITLKSHELWRLIKTLKNIFSQTKVSVEK